MKSNKLLILPVVLTTITLLSGIILSSTLTHADGNTDVVDELDVTVNSACTMKGGPNGTDDSGSSTYTTTINAGNYTELPGSKLVTLCNDPAGYAIYAIGYSGDSYDSQTHTDLIGTATTGNIQTGTSGNDSYWAMKLEAVEGLTPPSIVTDFQDYHVIPDTYTKVASYTTPTATASDAGATVQTKYKINISKTQLAGAYNGKVKYTMVHPNNDPAPVPPASGSVDFAYEKAGKTKYKGYYKMQDINDTIINDINNLQAGTLIDIRDDSTYTVAKIQGALWMTQNLRITGTVGSANSNFSTNPSVNVCTGDLTSGNSMSEPRCHDSGNTTNGVWYNYAAASALTITGNDNETTATEDICPANWKMPGYDTNKPAGTINSLDEAILDNLTAFSPVAGGGYLDGAVYNPNYGYWWSTVAENNILRYRLGYYGNSLNTGNGYRAAGSYIRCIRATQ